MVGGGSDRFALWILTNAGGSGGAVDVGAVRAGAGTKPIYFAKGDAAYGRIRSAADKEASGGADGTIGDGNALQNTGGRLVIKARGVVDENGKVVGGFHLAMGKGDIADGTAIFEINREAHIAVADEAIGEKDIPDGAGGFGSDFDGGAATFEDAVGDNDVLAGSTGGTFDDNGVVAGTDATIADAYAPAIVRINPIGVNAIASGDNVATMDVDILATEQVDGPPTGPVEADMVNFDIAAIDETEEGEAKLVGVGLGTPAPGVALAVDAAGAGKGDIGLPGSDQ